MTRLRRGLAAMPVLVRFSLVGAVLAGLVGAVAGLLIGLATYAPTAWFATLELGAPSAILGAIVGLAVGSIVHVLGRKR